MRRPRSRQTMSVTAGLSRGLLGDAAQQCGDTLLAIADLQVDDERGRPLVVYLQYVGLEKIVVFTRTGDQPEQDVPGDGCHARRAQLVGVVRKEPQLLSEILRHLRDRDVLRREVDLPYNDTVVSYPDDRVRVQHRPETERGDIARDRVDRVGLDGLGAANMELLLLVFVDGSVAGGCQGDSLPLVVSQSSVHRKTVHERELVARSEVDLAPSGIRVDGHGLRRSLHLVVRSVRFDGPHFKAEGVLTNPVPDATVRRIDGGQCVYPISPADDLGGAVSEDDDDLVVPVGGDGVAAVGGKLTCVITRQHGFGLANDRGVVIPQNDSLTVLHSDDAAAPTVVTASCRNAEQQHAGGRFALWRIVVDDDRLRDRDALPRRGGCGRCRLLGRGSRAVALRLVPSAGSQGCYGGYGDGERCGFTRQTHSEPLSSRYPEDSRYRD